MTIDSVGKDRFLLMEENCAVAIRTLVKSRPYIIYE